MRPQTPVLGWPSDVQILSTTSFETYPSSFEAFGARFPGRQAIVGQHELDDPVAPYQKFSILLSLFRKPGSPVWHVLDEPRRGHLGDRLRDGRRVEPEVPGNIRRVHGPPALQYELDVLAFLGLSSRPSMFFTDYDRLAEDIKVWYIPKFRGHDSLYIRYDIS